MTVFRLTMLPAADGDCLILTWGDEGDLRHAIVDGGRRGAYAHLRPRLETMAHAGEPLALYVLTHIDADHIEGALAFAEDEDRPIAPEHVWYNGFDETRLGGVSVRGERQGDLYRAAIERLNWPLNEQFDGGIASVENAPPTIDIRGLTITMLSPDAKRLAAMSKRWTDWRDRNPGAMLRGRSKMPDPLIVEDLLADGPTDPEAPNGASIAFVAEWSGRRVLLAGDAHPDALAEALAPLSAEVAGGRYPIDLLKVSHHGSQRNTTRQLLGLLACRGFAISTNGNLHGHPDPQAIARIVTFGGPGAVRLHFNYETERTRPWAAADLMKRHGYSCDWPTTPGEITIDLMAEADG